MEEAIDKETPCVVRESISDMPIPLPLPPPPLRTIMVDRDGGSTDDEPHNPFRNPPAICPPSLGPTPVLSHRNKKELAKDEFINDFTKRIENLFDSRHAHSEEVDRLTKQNKALTKKVGDLEVLLQRVTADRDMYRRLLMDNPHKRKAKELQTCVEKYRELMYELERERYSFTKAISDQFRRSCETRNTLSKKRKTFDPVGASIKAVKMFQRKMLSDTVIVVSETPPSPPRPRSTETSHVEAESVESESVELESEPVDPTPPPSPEMITSTEVSEEDIERIASKVLRHLSSSSSSSESEEEEEEEHEKTVDQGPAKEKAPSKPRSRVMRAAINGDNRRKSIGGGRYVCLPKDLKNYEWEKQRVLDAWKALDFPPYKFRGSRFMVSYGAINAKLFRLGYSCDERNNLWHKFLRICPYRPPAK